MDDGSGSGSSSPATYLLTSLLTTGQAGEAPRPWGRDGRCGGEIVCWGRCQGVPVERGLARWGKLHWFSPADCGAPPAMGSGQCERGGVLGWMALLLVWCVGGGGGRLVGGPPNPPPPAPRGRSVCRAAQWERRQSPCVRVPTMMTGRVRSACSCKVGCWRCGLSRYDYIYLGAVKISRHVDLPPSRLVAWCAAAPVFDGCLLQDFRSDTIRS